MDESVRIYRIAASLEEDRPEVNFTLPENAAQDWDLLNQVVSGQITAATPLPINAFVESQDALIWDYYGIPGIMSSRAVSALAPYATSHFAFFELALNGAPYFFPKPTRPLVCLDREKSVTVPYDHDPDRVMEVKKFCFKKELICDPLIFWIPESWSKILCTDSVRAIVDRERLRGFRFDDIEQPAGYRHPHSANP